jgi:indole-3-glycerol phosphate synthase/phosphoribosylanthranilate isomerase/anthranilate synthase/indole-3-glycerol phosphate synthase/phosphoribosylanthranilate isomerase
MVARAYEMSGAAAISVLTEEDYFGGSLDDLYKVKQSTSIPILRKDFIFDEYQVYESYVAGADALLLIAAALDDETLTKLLDIAEHYLWMDALVEVHNKGELERALRCGANIIGVNNRDLRAFEVSTTTSFELARLVPPELRLISESGLDAETVSELREVGYDGFLVGESLMRSENPAKALHDLIVRASKPSARVQTKVCGITSLEDAVAACDAGADMLGFNFYPQSPRFIEPDAVWDIVFRKLKLRRGVRMIGVFVNETLERIKQVADRSYLDGIQLHGDETAEFCRQLKASMPHRFLIKAFAANEKLDVAQLAEHPADAILLDASDRDLRGGTGKTADWSVAREAVAKLPRVFLAGGLSPDNVASAIAAVRPYAVDACSRLETTPGRKDQTRVREFVAAVRAVKLPDEATTR